ncbi:MAG: purine-binding chemotaxis protein CheW [Deltaproteobacteria bacterium]|nr:purine-binding chemotaxis protein CheW [Deltaproteobacteria bacterium]
MDNELKLQTTQRVLCFSLGKLEYAIPLISVREVIAIPVITSVPYTPPHFLGIMNLRGQILSVIDLRMKFSLKSSRTEETAVVICDLQSLCVGFVVDSVNFVLEVQENSTRPNPQLVPPATNDCIVSLINNNDRLIMLLDIAKALNLEDHSALNKASALQRAA